MPLPELSDYTQEELESQHITVNKINTTHIGVENLFSEMRLLNDLEILREQVKRCQENPDNRARTLLGMTISVMRSRNPRIAQLYPS